MSERVEPFEQYTARYEIWFDRNEYAYGSELKAIEELLPESGHGIEIGVGSGKFAEPLGIQIGVDPSIEMLKIAKERSIDVIRGIGEYLPVERECFNFALVVTTICFFDDVERSLNEIYEILKDEGHIIIGFVDRESKLGKIYQDKKDENVFYKEATFYSSEELLNLLKKSGFNQIETVQTLFGEIESMNKIDEVKEGYDEGSFVVVKAKKIV